ncbi:MAG: fluoride efflux transporter CrcB [Actinomycetes bacterium]
MTALLVVAGAAVGAPCRYLVDRAVQARVDAVLPWGTLAVNVAGSLLLGLLLAAHVHGPVTAAAVALAGAGFAGAFTTYSTFAYETVRLVEEGAVLHAVANVALNVTAGLLAAGAGWGLGRLAWA